MEKFKPTLVFIIYVLSAITTGLFVLMAFSITLSDRGFSFDLVVLGGALGGVTYYFKRQVKKSKDRIIERHILKMAIANDGLVTALEVAANHSLRLEDVRNYLEECYENNICEKRYTEDGLAEVFYFRDSIPLDVKKKAKAIAEN